MGYIKRRSIISRTSKHRSYGWRCFRNLKQTAFIMNTSFSNKSGLEIIQQCIEASQKINLMKKAKIISKSRLNLSKSISYLPRKTKSLNFNAIFSSYAIIQASSNFINNITLKLGSILWLNTYKKGICLITPKRIHFYNSMRQPL